MLPRRSHATASRIADGVPRTSSLRLLQGGATSGGGEDLRILGPLCGLLISEDVCCRVERRLEEEKIVAVFQFSGLPLDWCAAYPLLY